jgi:D-serine deaminase-like pyridoxal phosphate-dependent protein
MVTYVFNDNMQIASETAKTEHIALSILATVVSRPAPDVATLDAGAKVFSGDVNPTAAGLNGYGQGFGGLDPVVERMNEEHGVVRLGALLNPKVGEALRFVPNHVCTSVNLSDELIGIRGDRVETVWAVAARGMRE